MSEAPASPSPTPGERDLGRSSRGASVLGWSLALAGSALLLVAGLFLVRWVEHGPTPPYLQGDGLETPGKAVHERAPKPGNLLRLAGSGSNLPLTRALADAFVATRPWLRIRVHESIGSGGGIKAADDQVIEIGLASRPLEEREQQLGMVSIPYARVAVVVAANPSVPVRSVAREDLLDYWGKRRTHWDDGSPVVVLQREPGDSSHLAAAQAIPGFGDIDDAAAAAHYWRVLYNERAMQDALVSTFGAIGLFDQGLMVIQDLPLVALEFEHKRPSEEAVRTGEYPLYKDLSFVIPDEAAGREPDPLALEFINFVFSSRGQEIIRRGGYVPLEPPPHSSFAHVRSFGPLPGDAQAPGEPVPVDQSTDTGSTGATESGDSEKGAP